jgi:hypothetical protein
MNSLLLEDAKNRPEVFLWNSPISRTLWKKWLETQGVDLPKELVAVLRETGGGDIFESETILAPFGGEKLDDNIEQFNEECKAEGMPQRYYVFHRGLKLSAVRLTDQKYVVLSDDSFFELAEYQSLQEWYLSHLRAEYAARYGLPDLKRE